MYRSQAERHGGASRARPVAGRWQIFPRLSVFVVASLFAGRAQGLCGVQEIVGALNGKVYHTQADCNALKKISPENRTTFVSVEQAEAEGRRLCKVCERLAQKGAKPKEEGGAPKPGPKKTDGDRHEPRGATTRPGTPAEADDARSIVVVKAVVAGGTLRLEKGEVATVAGVLFPAAGQEMSREGQSLIEQRVRGRKITLIGSLERYPRDALGRLRVSIQPGENKPDLGGELIDEGLAWVDRSFEFPGRAEYLKKETAAWQRGRGIWKRLEGAEGMVEVVAGRYASSYHPIGCAHEVHLTEPTRITLNEAKARRLTPCEMYRMAGGGTTGAASADPNPRDKEPHEEKE